MSSAKRHTAEAGLIYRIALVVGIVARAVAVTGRAAEPSEKA